MRWMLPLSAALLLSVTAVRAIDGTCEYIDGGVVRGPQSQKRIALEFSAHEFVEGAPTILDQLASRHLKASFFLTGRCARRAENKTMIRRMIKDGHYVGPHSNSHPLLCPWTGKKRTLVTKDFFVDDLKQNLSALENAGVQRERIKFFMPPYEWYTSRDRRLDARGRPCVDQPYIGDAFSGRLHGRTIAQLCFVTDDFRQHLAARKTTRPQRVSTVNASGFRR